MITRRILVLTVVSAAVLATAVVVVLTRGGSGSKAHLVPFEEFKSVPLDTPRRQIEHRFGTALRSEPAGKLDPGTTCLFYPAPADARPATEYEFCFLDGRLHSKFAG